MFDSLTAWATLFLLWVRPSPDLKVKVKLKGSVQRKLRWVENGVNRSEGTSDCGAGHYFDLLF